MKPLRIIRYIIIFSSIIVMFFNLFDCIIQSVPFSGYILYVVLFLAIPIILIFSQSTNVMIWIIFVISILTILFNSGANTVSYAVIFLSLSTFIKREAYYRLVTYFTSLICAVLVNVNISKSPIDMLNVIIAYTVVYSLSELTYQEIIRRNK